MNPLKPVERLYGLIKRLLVPVSVCLVIVTIVVYLIDVLL
jgi:hypothetical protein